MKRNAFILQMVEENQQKQKKNEAKEIDKENIPSRASIIEYTPPRRGQEEEILQIVEENQDREKTNETNEAKEIDREDIPSSPSIIENTPPPRGQEDHILILNANITRKPLNDIENAYQSINEESKATEKTSGTMSSERPRSRSSSTSSSSSSSSGTNRSSTSSSSSSSITNENAAIPGPSTSNLRPQTGNQRSYIQSPINQNESDVDLSDSDPTFRAEPSNNQRSRRISSTSSESLVQPSKSRKRKRNPVGWKQNKNKISRNSGKSYRSLSKSKKVVPARHVKETCTSKCRLKCFDNVNENERTDLFNNYWRLSNLEFQRAYIRTCIMEVQPRYKYSNAQKPRLPNNAFYFTVNGQRIRVCKLFFINTLDISDRQLRTVKSKTNSLGFVEPEGRGKHENKKRVDPELLQFIRKHIESIPRVESHYIRATSSREYIYDGKTIRDLWTDFNNDQKEKNLPQCDYWLYLNTFNKDFNISFFQPKKDRCETCVAYQLAPESTKTSLKPNYDKHLKEKELCRQEKRIDRQNIDETHVCAIYDLQSVMLCPSPEYFYYCSKINCLDFTITELKKGEDDKKCYGDVYCYFWDETQGQRGANEIGSCIFDYLSTISRNNADKKLHVTFYSDNCTGQNKNKVIASLYSYAVAHFGNIESITHKYLIKGHTQNEADNVHSLIEKEIKKNVKAGPIYVPVQFPTLIKSARKSGKPFIVKEVNHEFFLNLKQLQERWAYNFNENIDKAQVLWNGLKILKFIKEELFHFYYKTSYSDETFSLIDMRNKRKKMLSYNEIVIAQLYDHPLELKEKKKKDLKDLVQKNLIPSIYASFINSL